MPPMLPMLPMPMLPMLQMLPQMPQMRALYICCKCAVNMRRIRQCFPYFMPMMLICNSCKGQY